MSLSYYRLTRNFRRSLLGSFRSCNGLHSSVTWRCSIRSACLEDCSGLTVGERIHGYKINDVTEIPDFSLVAVQLTHEKTGAQHLHVARDDTNNVFSVGFKTVPMDSSGVPHILEHTALCGSERFPIRDPFFKMLTRSLSTFMNAFTASDWTMYPFSTQNSKDFQNLLSVYLDSAFFPQLKELDFRQEGWRLEHEDAADPSSPIVFKGVVFNEMKGHFANSESLFTESLQNKLLPSHTYSHVSGGWPLDILNLTWEDLKEFHTTHYHPSNARFYTYGDMPLSQHLQQISQQVLDKFKGHITTLGLEVPLEPKWKEPREHHIHCPPDPMAPDPDKQTTVAVSFLQAPITDPYECLVLSILGQLLIGGPPSPFYQALVDANIGSGFSPGTGYDNGTKDSSFTVGLQNIKKEDVPHVKEIIWNTLEKVASEGFPEERIKAVLHQIELNLKHESSSFGLSLISSLMTPWIHSADPVAAMKVNELLQRFKDSLKNSPTFLQDKVKECFLDNRHHMTLTMAPEEDYQSKQEAKERDKLSSMVSTLSDKERQRVFSVGMELQTAQDQKQDLECLPTLQISDVDRNMQYTKLDLQQSDGVLVQYSEQPTNGITYFRAVSGTGSIPDHLRVYVPLFCSVITKMGAGDMDHRQFAQLCDLYTGGLDTSPLLVPHHSQELGLEHGVLLSSYCLDRHLPYMFSLWEDVFDKPNLTDLDRLKTLVNMAASDLSVSVAHSGHSFAMTAAAQGLSPAANCLEVYGGMTQVEFLKKVAEQDLNVTMQHLANVAATVLDCGDLRCSVNAMPESMGSTVEAMDGFVSTLPGSSTDEPGLTEDTDFVQQNRNFFYQMPFPVYFVGRSFRSVAYTHEDFARLTVLAKLVSSRFLHREIREKGGAYGSGARQSQGIFSFFSYRDPNSTETLLQFQKAVEWCASGDFSDRDIDEAKLAVFSQLDNPVSPGSRGLTHFIRRIPDELRQQNRERTFQVTKEDLLSVTKRYLGEGCTRNSAVIGPPSEEMDKLSQDWEVKNFQL